MSAYEQLNGVAPTPAKVTNALTSTGTPQNLTATGALKGHIGPMPNLRRALPLTDLKAPTAPTQLNAVASRTPSVTLKWTASTDNVGVASYVVYRNGTQFQTTSSTGLVDSNVSHGATYSYKVVAKDAAGHSSPFSNTVSVQVP